MRWLLMVFGMLLLLTTGSLTLARLGTDHLLWLEFTMLPPNSAWVYCRLYMNDGSLRCGDKAATSQARVWSPDGKWGAFAAIDESGELWTLYRRRANSRQIENLLTDATFTYVDTPAWSPNGEWLLFSAQVRGKDFDIYRMPSDGGALENLTHHLEGDQWLPSWSPDGQWIAFTTWEFSAAATLALMRADGGEAHVLLEGLQHAFRPTWSPDGEWLLFESGCEDLVNFIANQTEGFCNPVTFDVYRVHPDGTGLMRLTHSRDDDYAAAWSPDGKWISYVSRPLGGIRQLSDIYIMRPDGGDLQRLTAQSGAYVYPIWSPRLHLRWRWAVLLLMGVGLVGAGYRPSILGRWQR